MPASTYEPTPAQRIDDVVAAWRQLQGMSRGRSLRVVMTDSESPDGIAYACGSPEHPAGEDEAVYDCCDTAVIHTYSQFLAEFLVTAFNEMPYLLAAAGAVTAVGSLR